MIRLREDKKFQSQSEKETTKKTKKAITNNTENSRLITKLVYYIHLKSFSFSQNTHEFISWDHIFFSIFFPRLAQIPAQYLSSVVLRSVFLFFQNLSFCFLIHAYNKFKLKTLFIDNRGAGLYKAMNNNN